MFAEYQIFDVHLNTYVSSSSHNSDAPRHAPFLSGVHRGPVERRNAYRMVLVAAIGDDEHGPCAPRSLLRASRSLRSAPSTITEDRDLAPASHVAIAANIMGPGPQTAYEVLSGAPT